MATFDESTELVTITPWENHRCLVTANAPSPREAIAIALTGLVAAYHNEMVPRSQSTLATRALGFRAEQANLQALVRGLIEEIVDVLTEEVADLEDIQFDGLVRTDNGLAGWGYVLVRPGEPRYSPIAVVDVTANADRHQTTLSIVLGRD
jgi:hypothetical protein